jgi:Neprosin
MFMKAVKGHAILRMALVLITMSTALVAQEAKEFVSFRAFIANTTTADSGGYLARSTSRVKDAESLEQMRQHILTMYHGVEVSHSFLLHSQYFDCVSVEKQPSVRLLHLKSIASAPPQSVLPAKGLGDDHITGRSSASASQLSPGDEFDSFGNSVQCEERTIPMRRITLEELSHFKTLKQFLEKGPNGTGRAPEPDKPQAPSAGHKYAYTYQYVNNLGGNSSLNLWSPYVNNAWFIGEVFSLSQQWYVGGNQTAEGGWQNYPSKYGSENAALFIYWTADGYQNTGCYNLDCAAFVQVNHNWYFGSGFANYSVYGGAQYSLPMQWYLYAGNWWLQLGGQWVGYYPGSIYGGGQMSRNAQLIEYGGETVGSWIWPPMGSGQFANTGWTHAAYQRTIWYRDTASSTHWAGLTAAQPSPSCYTDAGPAWGGAGWGIYFFFGGPGGTGC